MKMEGRAIGAWKGVVLLPKVNQTDHLFDAYSNQWRNALVGLVWYKHHTRSSAPTVTSL